MRSDIISAVSLSLFASAAHAQVSLWIPYTDPQPISAKVLGVGGDGRTTWELQQGTLSGTFSNTDAFGFSTATATLVEGPSDAVFALSISGVEVTASCAINNGMAACVRVQSGAGGTSTVTNTQPVSSFAVQVGGGSGGSASAPAPTGASESSGSAQASAGSSAGSAGAQPTGGAGGTSAAGRLEITGGLLFLGIIGNVISHVL